MTPSGSTPIARKLPLIGRGPELRELEETLAKVVTNGTPATIVVSGAAGLGKTRLVDEFLARVRERERKTRILRAPSRPGDGTFAAIERLLRGRFGIAEGAAAEAAQLALRTGVSDVLGDKRVTEFLHFLGTFLGLAFPESPFTRALEDDGDSLTGISRTILRRFIEVDASTGPLVLTFDDLHLASTDTIDLVDYLSGAFRNAPVLVVVTARPELLAKRVKGAFGAATRLELGALSADEAGKMMFHLLEPLGEVPDELVDLGTEMASGSPYLLERTVQAFFEAGVLGANERGAWTANPAAIENAHLTLSVDDAVNVRTAALGPAERELLEMAVTMGGVFWLGALVSLGRLLRSPPELWAGSEDLALQYRDLLASLEERDYVLQLPDSAIAGDTEYMFKHNLERETLYRRASVDRMRQYHRVVAEWLEFRLAERGEAQCEMLAEHYELGGLSRKAAHHYLRAADQARERYANVKAAEYYEKGLKLLGADDVYLQVEALHHQGDVLQLSGQNEEALRVFRHMLDIAYRFDLKGKGGAAHNRIGRLLRSIGRLEEAMRHLGSAFALFDAVGDQRGVAASHDDVGKVHWFRGAYELAEEFHKKALVIRRELGDRRSIALSLNNLGLVYQDSGRFAEALAAFQEALAIRREIGDRPGIAQTLNNLGTIHQDRGEDQQGIALWNEALEYTLEIGDRMHQAAVLTNLGEAHYRLGRPAEALRVLQQAEKLSATVGDRILEAEILRALAKAHMLVNELAKAREYVSRAVSLFEEARSKPFLGVALRTSAEIHAAAGWGGDSHQHAVDQFERAIAIFDELGNQVEIARTCRAYALFLRNKSQQDRDSALAARAGVFESRANEIQARVERGQGPDATRPMARTLDPFG